MNNERGGCVLTPAQAEWALWALDAMAEYWADEIDEADPNGAVPRPVVLPTLRGRRLTLLGVHPDVMGDLHYRLIEQAPDVAEMAETEQARRGGCDAAANAWVCARNAWAPAI